MARPARHNAAARPQHVSSSRAPYSTNHCPFKLRMFFNSPPVGSKWLCQNTQFCACLAPAITNSHCQTSDITTWKPELSRTHAQFRQQQPSLSLRPPRRVQPTQQPLCRRPRHSCCMHTALEHFCKALRRRRALQPREHLLRLRHLPWVCMWWLAGWVGPDHHLFQYTACAGTAWNCGRKAGVTAHSSTCRMKCCGWIVFASNHRVGIGAGKHMVCRQES